MVVEITHFGWSIGVGPRFIFWNWRGTLEASWTKIRNELSIVVYKRNKTTALLKQVDRQVKKNKAEKNQDILDIIKSDRIKINFLILQKFNYSYSFNSYIFTVKVEQ